jgi:hypothetical protein
MWVAGQVVRIIIVIDCNAAFRDSQKSLYTFSLENPFFFFLFYLTSIYRNCAGRKTHLERFLSWEKKEAPSSFEKNKQAISYFIYLILRL